MIEILPDKAIIIFVKNPQLGKVKTRLAATVGDDIALTIYHKLCEYTRKITQSINAEHIVFYSDFIEDRDGWSLDFYKKEVQIGKDLGERMFNAFKMIESKYSKCIIIGSDCATLEEKILTEAFELLDLNDVVIGPAEDGGYYLLGMKRAYKSVFEQIEWSSETVFDATISKIEHLNLKYALLPTLSDIDTEYDWQKVAHRFRD